MWNVAAVRYDYPQSMENVAHGLLGESFEITEPRDILRLCVLAEGNDVILGVSSHVTAERYDSPVPTKSQPGSGTLSSREATRIALYAQSLRGTRLKGPSALAPHLRGVQLDTIS